MLLNGGQPLRATDVITRGRRFIASTRGRDVIPRRDVARLRRELRFAIRESSARADGRLDAAGVRVSYLAQWLALTFTSSS